MTKILPAPTLTEAEARAIANAPLPRTRTTIAHDLRQLGVQEGMVLLVHSAMSKLGWIAGGPVAVIQALLDVLGPEGTLVMPTFSGDYSNPENWRNPPVPAEWFAIIQAEMPAFDPRYTPTRAMGRIAETFRVWPDVMRSYHPNTSFTAYGRYAHPITANHALAFSLGEESPLRRLYDLDAHVLLMGVGYGNNTSFHLAEYRIPHIGRVRNGGPIYADGRRVWQWFEDVDTNDDPFPDMGQDFEKKHPVSVGKIGSAESRLFRQRTAVDFAEQWLPHYYETLGEES